MKSAILICFESTADKRNCEVGETQVPLNVGPW